MVLAQGYIVLGSAAVFPNRSARQLAADIAVAAANALLAGLAVLGRELESAAQRNERVLTKCAKEKYPTYRNSIVTRRIL